MPWVFSIGVGTQAAWNGVIEGAQSKAEQAFSEALGLSL
jgi:hypothetical protein